MGRLFSDPIKRFMRQWTLGNRRHKRWACRCTRCGTRQTKKQHPDEYLSPLKCRSCKRTNVIRIDWYRMAKEWGVKPCDPNRGGCGGYHFPHARGRGFCEFNKKKTAEDFQDRAESGSYRTK